MSHYCVGVIVKDIDNFEAEIEEILAPYDENLEVKPYLYKTKAQLIEEGKKFAEAYFADPANQEKWIVWVDCHI